MFKNTKPFTGYSVDDKEAALTFYRDTLGLDAEMTPEGIAMNFTNGASVFLYEKKDHKPATFTVLNFPVDDIDAAVDELIAKGIKMEGYENLGMPVEPDEKGIVHGKASGMGPDIAWFTDPAGNILSVLNG